jgi:hypothetical protein
MAGADRVDLTIATAQLKAFSRWRGSRGLPEYTYFHGIDGAAAPAARPRKRRSRSGGDGDASGTGRGKMSRRRARGNPACESVEDALKSGNLELSPQMTKMGLLMSRAAQQMSLSPVILRANGSGNPPKFASHMGTCTSVVDELPAANNGASTPKDNRTCKVPPVDEQAGLVLNFTSASAVPSTSDLAMIFSQFGPIKEASARNSAALVVFKQRDHAEEAFGRTAKIRATSSSLISFHLTHSLPPATTEPPVRESREDGCPGR